MNVKHLVVGMLSTNCYILQDDKTREVAVIDPGAEEGLIERTLRQADMKPSMILLTHGHLDHFSAASALADAFDCPIRMHKDEVAYLQSDIVKSMLYAPNVFAKLIDRLDPAQQLTDGEIIRVGSAELRAIEVPGHTPHSLCFYADKQGLLFCGDTLFAGSIGRTDLCELPPDTLIHSIREKLMVLPDDTTVLPGHGLTSTIGSERKNNPFVGDFS